MIFFFLCRKDLYIANTNLKNRYIIVNLEDVEIAEKHDNAIINVYRVAASSYIFQRYPELKGGHLVCFTQEEWNRCHTAELLPYLTITVNNKSFTIEEGKTDSEEIVTLNFH